MKDRKVYLDNLKGIAAFFVMIHHLLVAYLPVSYYGSNIGAYFDTPFFNWVSQTPLSFFVNGNFWVFVFFVISGYLMFAQGHKVQDTRTFSSKLLNRHIKLLFPIIPICIVLFVIKNLTGTIFYNDEVGRGIGSSWLQSGYDYSISFKTLLLSPLTIFLKGDGTFSNAFWMLDKLLISSLMVFVVAYAFQNVRKNILPKYLLICFGSLFLNAYYLPTFLGGLIYLLSPFIKKIKNKKFYFMMIFLIGIFFAGYPSGRVPTNVYRYLEKYRILKTYLSAVNYYHTLGAFFILMVVINSNKVKQILECKWLSVLGKNSYSIYLTHIPLIYLVSPYLFVFMIKWTNRYLISTGITIILISSIVIFTSIYYTKFMKWLKNCCYKMKAHNLDQSLE